MKNTKKLAALTLAGLLISGSGVGFAIANQSGEIPNHASIQITNNDEASFANLAQININQALSAAQKSTQGKPIKAALENENGYLVWNVELASNNQIHEVKVDAKDGKILKIEKDSMDHEKKHGEDND